MIAIRGANSVVCNTTEAILEATEVMLKEVMEQNSLKDEEMISIFFSATKDLNAVYPAIAARKLGITNASLLCLQEMDVKGSIKMCVRLLMHVNKDIKQKDVKHVYLGEASCLRPDLIIRNKE